MPHNYQPHKLKRYLDICSRTESLAIITLMDRLDCEECCYLDQRIKECSRAHGTGVRNCDTLTPNGGGGYQWVALEKR